MDAGKSYRNWILTKISATSTYDILRPVSFCAMLFGVMPLNAASKTFENNRCVLLWSITVSIINVAFGIIHFLYPSITSDALKKSVTYRIVFRGAQSASVLYIVVLLTTEFSLKNKLLYLSTQLSKLDDTLKAEGYSVNAAKQYKLMKLKNYTATLLISLFIIYVITTDIMTFSGRIILEASHIGAYILYDFILFPAAYTLIQMCTYLAIIKEMYKWLNKIIQNIITVCSKQKGNINSSKFKKTFEQDVIVALSKIQKIHMRLHIVCRYLSDAYSLQLLVMIFRLLLTQLCAVFVSVHYYLQNDWGLAARPEIYIFYLSGILLLNCTFIFGIALSCSATVNEAKRTANLLHDVYFPSVEIDCQVVNFSTQLLLCKTEFSVFDLFLIDETLAFTLMSSIFTYIVITIQLDWIALH